MRDNLIRRIVKGVALLGFYTTLSLTRMIQRISGARPYRLGGRCEGCAKCCEQPGIQVSNITWHTPAVRRLFLWYQSTVNGFLLEDRIPHQRVFLFRCTHFDKETRKCDSYSSRPGMCRDYPRNQLWQPLPQLLDGCGYRPIHPQSAKIIEQLEREGLSGKALEEVKTKMHLDDGES